MAPKIERLSIEVSLLGEGPHWDTESQTLYYVDIFGSALLRYTPSTKKIGKVSVAPKRPSFIVPVSGKKNQFVVSLDREVAIISWDGQSDKFSVIEVLCNISGSDQKTFNDGKCDSAGRLWAGTLELDRKDVFKTLPVGSLYSINSKRELKEQIQNVSITNGLAFNDKLKKMYYIDSLKGTIDRYDFDPAVGNPTNREELFTLKKHDIPGIPDGMTIDTDGNLWVAIFYGNRVIKIDAKRPEVLLQTIELPALQVTSVIWGGQNLDELYVTTGSFENAGEKPPTPQNGSIYKITNTGSKGWPGHNFKLN